ncbi:LysE family translocator [Bradyrhizobium sp. 2TAF24]|uniref:LysE family translocator n=1 Tax=Bradyrhizobium sp. 2TAF24 TaxID=3233011 RepID=UPI003F916F2E
MSQHLLVAFVVFAVVALYTPGPNNVMLMTSGLNFGFRRTLPHVAGVAIGYAFLVGVIGFGLGAVFETWPVLQTVLKYAGCAYLVYLAVAIARSGPADAERAAEGRPLSFFGAALFQWINVKGWVIAIGTITAYAAVASYPWNIMILTALLLVLGLSSSLAWALFGTWLKPIVTSPRAVRVFNVAMALLLLASLYPVLTEA